MVGERVRELYGILFSLFCTYFCLYASDGSAQNKTFRGGKEQGFMDLLTIYRVV